MTPVILSGGSGTRLWPLSVSRLPKQFQPLIGDRTMIQDTALRPLGLEGVSAPLVVCNAAQVPLVREQLGVVGAAPRPVVIEPEARNTGPAVAAAAMLLDPGVVMAVLPADHVITELEVFRRALVHAREAAAGGAIVTFGVIPTRPDVGFGYLEVGEVEEGVAPLVRFVEKPDRAAAERYVESGYLWNSGMFVFTAGTILEELERRVPDLVSAVTEAVGAAELADDATVRLGPAFSAAPSISIDNAVMEHTEIGKVVPLDAGWSDVGSWQSLWEVSAPDGETVTVGDVYAVDVERSYLRSGSKPLAVIGLSDVVVVETEEAVLVIDRRRAQEVRGAAKWFGDRSGPA